VPHGSDPSYRTRAAFGFLKSYGKCLPLQLFTGFALANKGHDTRALQAHLGHRDIQHTVLHRTIAGSVQGLLALAGRHHRRLLVI